MGVSKSKSVSITKPIFAFRRKKIAKAGEEKNNDKIGRH